MYDEDIERWLTDGGAVNEEVQERFYDFMKTFLRTEGIADVSAVIRVEEDSQWSAGCETCSFNEELVLITYVDYFGNTDTYTYYGDLAGMLGVL